MKRDRSRMVGLASLIGPMVFPVTIRTMVAAVTAVWVEGESNELIWPSNEPSLGWSANQCPNLPQRAHNIDLFAKRRS